MRAFQWSICVLAMHYFDVAPVTEHLCVNGDVSLQGAEKTILSKMLVEGSNKRTYAMDRHAGVVSPLLP